MAEGEPLFECSEHPEHLNEHFTGQIDGKAWNVCSTPGHDTRVLTDRGEVAYCELETCEKAKSDHPTPAQIDEGQVGGYAAPDHTYVGDGTEPCRSPVALARLVGFLCQDCGAQLVGMPTKD